MRAISHSLGIAIHTSLFETNGIQVLRIKYLRCSRYAYKIWGVTSNLGERQSYHVYFQRFLDDETMEEHRDASILPGHLIVEGDCEEDYLRIKCVGPIITHRCKNEEYVFFLPDNVWHSDDAITKSHYPEFNRITAIYKKPDTVNGSKNGGEL
jgi:hypothetical protein